MFDNIVMVEVSQSSDLINIQGEIAKLLDIELFGGNNLFARAEDLQKGLGRSGRVLVILDDVWETLELNKIGIPCGDDRKGCKIVMTSRSKDVCNSTGTQENFEMTQMAVAKECGGLPIAIITVGRALRCKKKYSWDDALDQLQKCIVKNISDVDEKVFKPLKLSYDKLESDEDKKYFLLCSLYPEDFAIPIENLVRYAIGMELFERIDSVHQARNRVYSSVDKLKNCYLLMDSKEGECVKMHDVVRDVAISIASREEHPFVVRCDEVLKEWPKKDRLQKNAAISLKVDGMHWLPSNLEFPNLKLLQLDCNARLPRISYDLNEGMEEVKVQETQDSLYQGMKELKVLALSDMYSLLPTSLGSLTNLQTLSLFRCRLIDDISIIGALPNLEVLSFAGSYIKELPKEIIGHLKVLDLLGCIVERIYPGVLSSLSKLEELYLGSIFQTLFKVEESKEGAKAIINELASLSNLVALDIVLLNMEGQNLSDIETRFDLLLKRTEILVLTSTAVKLATIENLLIYEMENLREIWPGELQAKLREMTVRKCHWLSNILFPSNSIKGMQNLELLIVEDCRSIEVAFDLEGLVWEGISDMAFPLLKRVELRYLPKLTHVWKDNSQGIQGFQNLRSLIVIQCDSLRNLFSYSLAKLLVKLQEIEVTEYGMMESIIANEPNADIAVIPNIITFPQLSSLKLSDLPNLRGFCSKTCTFEGSLLKTIKVINSPKMKILPSAFQRKLEQQKAQCSTSSQHLLFYGKMGDSSIEVTEENHDASHEATVQAMETIS
ncbi:Disease resistance protein [Camellia lanceoleosa]|uniref:Disease resistance protein n=1 Tax=Camellia lanceoleosa TaxID=1840588 RepID=A0ACC0FGW7_9ERIC|nr:Disease resistance protein [Camellia lanceoleosa]